MFPVFLDSEKTPDFREYYGGYIRQAEDSRMHDEIPFEELYRQGIGSDFDVDNTLVPHGAPADDRAIALFRRLHELGFSMMLLSNNKEPRVKSFAMRWKERLISIKRESRGEKAMRKPWSR